MFKMEEMIIWNAKKYVMIKQNIIWLSKYRLLVLVSLCIDLRLLSAWHYDKSVGRIETSIDISMRYYLS